MLLRPHAVLSTILVLLTAFLPAVAPTLAQEVPPPGGGAGADEDQGDEAEEAEAVPADRLIVRVGPAAMLIRGTTRSHSVYHDSQTGDLLTQVNEMRFDSASGSGFMADGWYEVQKGWYVIGSLATASFGQADYVDRRELSISGGPGEQPLVTFGSQHESDLLDWSIGGAKRVFPTKRFKDSRLYVDAILLLSATDAEFTFEAGEILEDPFASAAYDPALGYDPRGLEKANYDLEYKTMLAGVRFGGQMGDRFSLEGHFLPVWFGSFKGTADLGTHGSSLMHPLGTVHGVIGDPLGAGAAEVVETDLFAPSLQVRQKSNRVGGLKVGLNAYMVITEWLTLDFGYMRNFFRSIGGKETRTYSDEDIAGCPSPGFETPGDPNSALPPKCADDHGDLLKSSLVNDSIYVMGRFHLY